MSENQRQSETGIVINDKSQDTAGRHLRYCEIFAENLRQIYCWFCCWKNF